MPSKSTAKSNLTVSAALYEDVRCKLGDAEQTISDLNEKVAGLKDELDTAKYFRDALDFEPEQEQQTKTNSNETCRPELRCPTGHELVRSGRLESLSVSDGALLWSVDVAAGALTAVGVDPAHRCCQAAVSASGCVAAADGSVSIFDFGTRSPPVLVGRLQLPAAVFCAPLLRGRRVLVGCRDDALHCLVIGPPQTVNERTPSDGGHKALCPPSFVTSSVVKKMSQSG